MASGLKTEKKPNKCDELNIVASSKRIRFWSAAPPLTLNPEEPSPALVTPGSSKMDFTTSASPSKTGIFLIVCTDKLLTLIWGFAIFNLSISSVTITSSSSSVSSNNLKFNFMFSASVTCCVIS